MNAQVASCSRLQSTRRSMATQELEVESPDKVYHFVLGV